MQPELSKDLPQRPLTVRQACIAAFCLTLVLTLAQGIARYRRDFGLKGEQFIALQKFDANTHAILAQRILQGEGYTLPIEHPRGAETVQPAFSKAPGYPYFLAALFSVTGFGFSYFPLQCLFGALLSVFAVLTAVEAFGDPIAGLVAGIAVAINPVLINLSSQLYNEDIYFCLFFLCVWLYLRWYRRPSAWLALACGFVAGVNALVRESMLFALAGLILWRIAAGWNKQRAAALRSAALMAISAGIVVLPWTIHNYQVSHEFVPISTISQSLLGSGNNVCVASESWTTPFYGDSPCPALDAKRDALSISWGKDPDLFLYASRANSKVGEQFILSHPGEYLELCVRRAWTMFDPWHPVQHLDKGRKAIMLAYFLLFVYAGVFCAGWVLLRGAPPLSKPLYVLLLFSYAPMVLAFISHDHRFAIGIHILLACFVGAWVAARYRSSRTQTSSARAA